FPKKEKITPEQAHEFAKEFAKKVWRDFQVIISTHIDRDHIHSHFIVNNVNLANGRKFSDNKKSLAQLQALNDALAKKYGFSVLGVDYQSEKYKGLNNATKETAKKRKSWKVELAAALKAAIENPSIATQESFTEFMSSKNFSINYSGKNITIRKNGEEKCIRLNTLAKEAGEIFKQDNIVKRFKINHQLIGEAPKKSDNRKSENKSYQKFEREYFQTHAPQYKTQRVQSIRNKSPKIDTNNSTSSIVKSVIKILCLLLFSRSARVFRSRLSFENKKYRTKKPTEKEMQNTYSYVGNINYKTLKDLYGENIKIKIYANQLSRLCNADFFYSGKVNIAAGTVEVTVKKQNVQKLAMALGLRADYYDKTIEQKENTAKYKRIKRRSEKVNYLVVSKSQLDMLRQHKIWDCVDIAVFEKKDANDSDKYNIAFALESKKAILDVLYPEQTMAEVKNAKEINQRLKESAASSGCRIMYRVITPEQLQAIANKGLEFAAFKKDDKYNIVFLESSLQSINAVLAQTTQKGGQENGRTEVNKQSGGKIIKP
ncbi:MAG: relaxase/mobilization nuclease domain-containing protein, partial [Acutalibacteraceae bacterium]